MNINQRCKVTLTKEGAKYLNNYHKDKIKEVQYIFDSLGANSSQIKQIYCTSYNEGDTLELPLWEIIGKFGKYFEIYTDAAFKKNEIILDDLNTI